VHYGLLPRANRAIFAINELPDLAGKIQVGLFNIMQEGDVQIKGYPVRLPARSDARRSPRIPRITRRRGKIITPLKDRSAARFARTTGRRSIRAFRYESGSVAQASVADRNQCTHVYRGNSWSRSRFWRERTKVDKRPVFAAPASR